MSATKEIGAMIKAMQDEMTKAIDSVGKEVATVSQGVQYAEDAGAALRKIVEKVDVVTSKNHQITTAMEEQSAVTEQITGAITEVATVVTQTTTSAHQIARASEEIAELAARLKSTVEVFKVKTASAERTVNAKGLKMVPLNRPVLLN